MHAVILYLCTFITCISFFTTLHAETTIKHAHIQNKTLSSHPQELYTFFKNMPKGGELHYHLAGGAYAEPMLAYAAQHRYFIDLKTFQISQNPTDGVSVKSVITNRALYKKILHAWSMLDFKEKTESNHDHFFNSFLKFMPLVDDFDAELLAHVVQRAALQHELYLEVMVLPDHAYSTTFAPILPPHESWAEKRRILLKNKEFQHNITTTILKSHRLLDNMKHHLACDTTHPRAGCNVTVKLQYYILREQKKDAMFAQAVHGFEAVARSHDLVGINIVQAEDGPQALHDYDAHMQIIQLLHHAYPKVHIALHAGELNAEQSTGNHIHKAVHIAGAQRIGHGVDIMHEEHSEQLAQYMAKHAIPVEINLTSNATILHVAGAQHPLPFYLNHHVPVVLSTDDEGILRTDLTQQYVDAVTQYHLDYPTIRQINRNTLTYSFLPGKSLWASSSSLKTVSACHDLNSLRCKKWIKKSPKATLQWTLEHQLADFEKHFFK